VLKTCPSELLQVEFSAWLTWAFQLFLLEMCFAISESQQSSCSRLHCQIIELGSLEMLGLGVAKLRRETLKLRYSCSVRCCRKLILFIPVIPRDCLKLFHAMEMIDSFFAYYYSKPWYKDRYLCLCVFVLLPTKIIIEGAISFISSQETIFYSTISSLENRWKNLP